MQALRDDDMDDYGTQSDDDHLDWFPAPKRVRLAGAASTASLVQTAAKDRRLFQQQAESQDYSFGAPSTKYNQDLWINRMDTYRRITLQQSEEHIQQNPFSEDEILGLFLALIPKIKALGFAPNRKLFINGHGILLDYRAFQYRHYKPVPGDRTAFKVWLSDKVHRGFILNGSTFPKAWATWLVVYTLTSRFLEFVLTEGTINLDVELNRILSIVAMCSMAARSGDIVVSSRYTSIAESIAQQKESRLSKVYNTHLRYKDIELKFEASLFVAFINLEATKGNKTKKNSVLVKKVVQFERIEDVSMDFVSLVFVQALRSGNVEGRTYQDLLTHVQSRRDHTVQWRFPERPLICCMRKTGQVLWDSAVSTTQVWNSIQEMSRHSGCLGRIHPHAIRRGAARDTANTPMADASFLGGYSTSRVRQTLGHSNGSSFRGVTDAYTGEPTEAVYNAISCHKPAYATGIKFLPEAQLSLLSKKRVFTEDEIQAYITAEAARLKKDKRDRRKLSDKPAQVRQRALRGLRKQHEESVRLAALEKGIGKVAEKPLAPIPPPEAVRSDATVGRLAVKPVSPVPPPEAVRSDATVGRLAVKPVSPVLASKAVRFDVAVTGLSAATFPTLSPVPDSKAVEFDATDAFDEYEEPFDFDAAELEDPSSSAILSLLDECPVLGDECLPEDEGVNEETADLLQEAMLEQTCLQETPKLSETIAEWIDRMARYNVVCVDSKIPLSAKPWLFGGSKDTPTEFVYSCPLCTKGFPTVQRMQSHQVTCSGPRPLPTQNVEERLPCTDSDCTKTFRNASQLRTHFQRIHVEFNAPCPKGCDPNILYATKSLLKAHTAKAHGNLSLYPTRCLVAACLSDKIFSRAKYRQHLLVDHNIQVDTEEKRKTYMPKAGS